MSQVPPRILKRRQVEERVGLTRSPIYARIKAGTFPKPIRRGHGTAAVGWLESEVDAWIAAQIAQRDAEAAA